MALWRRRCILQCDGEHAVYPLPRGDEKDQWLRFIFNTVPTQYNPYLLLCALHFTQDCFLNWTQFYCGLSKRLLLKDGAVPTLQSPIQDTGVYEYRIKMSCLLDSALNHVASQTDTLIDLPETQSVGTQAAIECPQSLKNAETQVRMMGRDRGVCTETLPLDSPLLLLQPNVEKKPSKRSRLGLADDEVPLYPQ